MSLLKEVLLNLQFLFYRNISVEYLKGCKKKATLTFVNWNEDSGFTLIKKVSKIFSEKIILLKIDEEIFDECC